MVYEFVNEKKSEKKSVRAFSNDDTIQTIQESSDVAQTIRELNEDALSKDNKFSNIDMKSRLVNVEISSIIALDSLVALQFLPREASFITRSKKRLSVSMNGLGRQEIVQISQGMHERQNGSSMFDKLGNFFRGGQ